MYEIRSLNFLETQVVTKHQLDEILWAGDFPQTYKKIRREVLRLTFKTDFLRAARVLAAKTEAVTLIERIQLLTSDDMVSGRVSL